ncbi:MAG: hypothetical protein M3548_08805, partial [Actinomycetota bacterium]|nr:hypothetical protein [Actinomycetota bacterium]
GGTMRTSAIGYGLLATATILPLSLVGTSATAAGSNASTAPADDPSGSRVDLVVKDTAPQAGLAVKSKTWSADGVDTNDDGDGNDDLFTCQAPNRPRCCTATTPACAGSST